MTTILGHDVLETLRCSLCHNFLSVPPIVSISWNGNQQKCGRCKDIIKDIEIRNVHFEKLATCANYPCIYRDCERILNWGEVKNHEEVCAHKTIRCPIYWMCGETIKISDLISHFRKKHAENLYSNESIEFGFYDAHWLISENKPHYLINIYLALDKPMFQVFSFYPSEILDYELTIYSDGSNVSVTIKNETVLYKDNVHCFKCMLGNCLKKDHPYSSLYEKEFPFDEIFVHIDPQLVKIALKSTVFQGKIVVKSESTEVPDDSTK